MSGLEGASLRALVDKASRAMPAGPGERWNLIEAKWWARLRSLAEEDPTKPPTEDSEPPSLPVLDNSPLLASTIATSSVPGQTFTPELRADLQELRDYALVPSEAWKALRAVVGGSGGPEIERTTIAGLGAGTFKVEILPLRLRILHTQTAAGIAALRSDPEDALKAKDFAVSLSTSVADLRAQIVGAFPDLQWSPDNVVVLNFLDRKVGDELGVGERGKEESLSSALLVPNQFLLALPASEWTKFQSENQKPSNSGGDSAGKVATLRSQPRGLVNLGNTCFMASAIQCLAHYAPLRDLFLSGDFVGQLNFSNPLGTKGELAKRYSELMKDLWNDSENLLPSNLGSVAPRNFRLALAKFAPRFEGFQQQDSSELLAYVLDGLHEDLNRIEKKPPTTAVELNSDQVDPEALRQAAQKAWDIHLLRNTSVVVDHFQAQLKSTVKCPDCHRVSVTFDPFMYLSVPLPSDSSRRVQVSLVGVEKCARQLTSIFISINRSAVMGDVKAKLAELLGIDLSVPATGPRKVLILAEVYQSKFQTIYTDADRLDRVAPSDKVFAFEVSLPSPDFLPIPVIQRRTLIDWDKSTSMHFFKHSTVSTPFFLAVQKGALFGETLAKTKAHMFAAASGLTALGTLPKSSTAISKLPSELSIDNFTVGILRGDQTIQPIVTPYFVPAPAAGDPPAPAWAEKPTPEVSAKTVLSLDWDLRFSPSNLPYHGLADRPGKDLAEVAPSLGEFGASAVAAQSANRSVALNVVDCLKLFAQPEKLSAENAWYCSTCRDHKQAHKQMEIWSAPPVLIIHLKRFTGELIMRRKWEGLVNFPLEGLDLSQALSPASPDGGANPSPPIYDLFAVSNHYGGMMGGHYTAFAKTPAGGWNSYDDQRVSPMDVNGVVSSGAYVLFYKKRTHPSTS